MRVATWNLESAKNSSSERMAAFHEPMQRVDADVWVLTETWMQFVMPGPYRLVAQTCAAVDVKADRRWVAIWSRLGARPLEVLVDPERMVCVRVSPPDGREVVLVGTVLPWRNDPRHAPRKGAAEFCFAIEAQSKEWSRLWGNPDTTSFCVAGDFNQETRPRHRTGTKHGQQAMARILEEFHLTCLTDNFSVRYPRSKDSSRLPVIDHICVGSPLQIRPGASVTTWKVPVFGNSARAITDHAGVAADLDILT